MLVKGATRDYPYFKTLERKRDFKEVHGDKFSLLFQYNFRLKDISEM